MCKCGFKNKTGKEFFIGQEISDFVYVRLSLDEQAQFEKVRIF